MSLTGQTRRIFQLGILLGSCWGLLSLRAIEEAARPVGFKSIEPQARKINNAIDEIVQSNLAKKGLFPADTCSDSCFIRRVYIDTIGTLPKSTEIKAFLSDARPDKRSRLIHSLLESNLFAEYWALKWGDLLRIKAEYPSNLWPQAAQAYHRWIYDSLRKQKPYDQFVKELLTANGSNFKDPPANFFRAFQDRAPRQIAENVALVFMGTRLSESGMTEDQILGLSAFFAKVGYKSTGEWKEEIVFFNREGKLCHPETKSIITPSTPDGKTFEILPEVDPRVVFADWLCSPDNRWFAKNISNRIWSWLTGRGIIHEVDDIRPSNEPWSPELLSCLEKELIQNRFDLKAVFRLILNSNIYQLSSQPQPGNAADHSPFTHYRVRRMDAEPLIDAICGITGTFEKYTSNIPEPFTFLPNNQRSIGLGDGSITSPFLEIFGRPPRNSSFEAERNNSSSVSQAQFLLNSNHIQKKILSSVLLQNLVTEFKTPRTIVEELYLRILSRFPDPVEQDIATTYFQSKNRTPQESVQDLAWVLINTKEFILKH